ncbi:MAG: DUF2934 domain-containing protein [Gammaproteobacteria bacterium]
MNDNSRLDKTTYDSSRIYLKAALEHMLETGRSVRELSEFAVEKFGADFLPYLRQFLHEVGHGRIVVKGLSRSARAALSAHTVSSEERERMIREAAYLRAERRGFYGGSAEQDWLDAEYEVDTRLAQGESLVAKGGRALAAVVATMEKELASSKQVVTRWLDRKFPTRKAGSRSRTAGAASRAAGAVESKPKKKKAIRKTPEKGSAAKNAAAAKPPTKKTAKKAAVKKKSSPGRSAATGKAVTANSRKKVAAKKKSLPATRKKTSTKKRSASGRSRRR